MQKKARRSRTTSAKNQVSPIAPTTQPSTNTGAFEHDVRDKPGLHRLYVEWAVRHLAIYEQAILAFDRESNLNMIDGLCVLIQERDKLIKTNAAYAEADKLIKIFKSVGPLPVQRDIEYNEEIDKDQS